MSRKLLIAGAGGHGRVVADIATAMGTWSEIAFIDDKFPGLISSGNWSVVSTCEGATEMTGSYQDMVVAVGHNETRMKLQKMYADSGFSIVTLIHPSVVLGSEISIGIGSVIMPNVAINHGTVFGDGCIVNTGAIVEHDCVIGEGVHLSPGCHLAGEVQVGNYSWIGIGSNIINQVCIGNSVIVGAGAAVIDDVSSNSLATGVPAQVKGSND